MYIRPSQRATCPVHGYERSDAPLFAQLGLCPSGYDTGRDDLPFRAIAQLFHGSNTVITMKPTLAFALLGTLVLAQTTAAQQKTFEWQLANDESVRLDPANYHTGRTYRPGAQGGNIHVDIESQRPVTIFLTEAEDWNRALQAPENIATVRRLCLREHVVKTTYLCDLPAEGMTLVIQDERNNPDSGVFAGLGAVLKADTPVNRAVGVGITTVLAGQGSATRRFVSPNDVHIQYYRWVCVSNCFPPEFQWIQQSKEKYELSSFLKVYGGYTPDRDGQTVSIKVKSPVPMLVALVPSIVADQLHGKPEMLESALEKNSCQQRGVQSQTFRCTFNIADGPQSLIVVPESGTSIPHKKAEIEFLAWKCIVNCALPPENGNSSAEKVNP